MRIGLSPKRGGFTLVELMIVLILIGIMTAMIVSEMKGSMDDAKLRSASRGLMDAFRVAYSQAVTLNTPHRVRVDVKGGRYVVERKSAGGAERGGFIPVQDAPGGEGRFDPSLTVEVLELDQQESESTEEPLPPEENEEQGPPPLDKDAIFFYADGTADPRRVVMRDKDGFGLALRIQPATARAQIVKLERE